MKYTKEYVEENKHMYTNLWWKVLLRPPLSLTIILRSIKCTKKQQLSFAFDSSKHVSIYNIPKHLIDNWRHRCYDYYAISKRLYLYQSIIKQQPAIYLLLAIDAQTKIN